MSAFVILAAGRGSRIGRAGEHLHKALIPLRGKAVISHLLELAPPSARIIVCLGYRGDQVRDYVSLAHPQRAIQYIEVENWNGPGSGPGTSLLAAQDAVGVDDLYFSPCDTLWHRDMTLWRDKRSWAGVAAVPPGTPSEWWCLVGDEDGRVKFQDKLPGGRKGWSVYTGLTHVARDDIPAFWSGLARADLVAGEKQISGGLKVLANNCRLALQSIKWNDVGDERSYQAVVAQWEGFDWAKPGEATYVLPEEGRVVKFFADKGKLEHRVNRMTILADAVPSLVDRNSQMLTYHYVPGITGYRAAEMVGSRVTRNLLSWASDHLWKPAAPLPKFAVREFYYGKTMARVESLNPRLRKIASEALSRIDWDWLAGGAESARIHGDLTLSNVVVTLMDDSYVLVDWREDWAGFLDRGDVRYDFAKLLTSMELHLDRLRMGDSQSWIEGLEHADLVREAVRARGLDVRSVETIAALCLLGSAPLHAYPVNEIFVAKGSAWLARL